MFAGSTNYQFWVTLYGVEGINSFMQRGMVSKIIRGIRWVIVQLLLLPVYFYRAAISPLTSASCRHVPTCSQYAIDAVKIHGPIKGFFMATNRILHCHPWGTSGYDPVPPKK